MRPDRPLDDWVRCFWFLETQGVARHTVVPDGRVEIVIHLAEPFTLLKPDGTSERQRPVLVAGQLTRPLQLASAHESRLVGIRFRSAAARDVLGCPLSEIRDAVVPAAEVTPHLAGRLERAARSSDPVPALSRLLIQQISRRTHVSTREAVRALERGDRIAEVARRCRISERTLQRLILRDTGLNPKMLQRVMRFRRLHSMMSSGSVPWGSASLRAGYYDQSHADRDFRRFAGMSPTEHFSGRPGLAAQFLSDSS